MRKRVAPAQHGGRARRGGGAGLRGGGAGLAAAQQAVPQQGGRPAGVAGRGRAARARGAGVLPVRPPAGLRAAAVRAPAGPRRRLPPRLVPLLLPLAALLCGPAR